MTQPVESIIGAKIVRLLQTPAEPAGVWIEQFGEAYYLLLVLELSDERRIVVSEFGATPFDGDPDRLIPAELVQDEFTLDDVQGRTIYRLEDVEGDFAVVLDNGLAVLCPCEPGGNFPWLWWDCIED